MRESRQTNTRICFLSPVRLPSTSLLLLQFTVNLEHRCYANLSSRHTGPRLTWAPPTVPCSRNRHMSLGKCAAERTGGCTGAIADPARGCSNPDTLSSSSRRRRGTEPTAERPPVPPGTPAAEPAEGPLRTAAAIFTRALVVAWRDDANTLRLSPQGVGA